MQGINKQDTNGSANMDAFWMPFTANSQFKAAPRMLVAAEGMYYTSEDKRKILDGTAGLWCCNAGHGRREISEAVANQIHNLDFAPTFQMGHPLPFEFAESLAEIAPSGLSKVFFTNSGSESVDTALKIALAYQRCIGQGTRTRLIGRERGYHGVGFGGISVGGIVNNRKAFGSLLTGVDHLPHTLSIENSGFSKGLPDYDPGWAESLSNIVTLHDASNIAAVIVEPIAGSTGVILPPKGYLKRLREICTQHGILLIFDEVITGFGRIGSPFAAQEFDVKPDIITSAKGLTNGAIPMGAVFVSDEIHQAMVAPDSQAIELFHGYTYSGHPVAAAAGLATLNIYRNENLYTRAADLADYWEQAVHSLKGLPHVKDLRNYGLIAGIELEGIAGKPGSRAFQVFTKCFEKGALIRVTGDIIALSPPLIIEKQHIDDLFTLIADVLQNIDYKE
ncbi:omega amino acid--pyruvate aminotransferase [Vibrio breoganii]|uniref:Aspartate aminotransferase family protein n=1 Tax=Vibrio breoganii TaxID=553239 RepID=A0ABX1U9X1_9VIBR|nr:aspartate aminotransferase family protein [Vibrio breoganii]NMO73181.1 aspartate aminotransferase family protein [Vibrio breoganii]NMR69555.1 aspartate aminotransferase family protein [Vibrio breoganii]PMG02169.1 omega amino acid--pyruvate aminotransferase [Vibrio breoganii]PML90299.1 omega amino acid--pyruvate aminotransferase [Vibrio breoganii]